MMRPALVLMLIAGFGCSEPPEKKIVENNTSNNTTSNNTTANNTTANNTTANNTPTNNPTANNTTGGGTADAALLDLLLVIDNSGSMCQEQRLLGESATPMLERIHAAGIDFQLGITTTHMNPDYTLEPVAKPGHLQSTPQPVAGFDRSCHNAVDSQGNAVPGDYAPVRRAIQTAVECTNDPSRYEPLTFATNADIECALYSQPQGCQIAASECGAGSPCVPEDLFPNPAAYRSIPTVLRSEDYRDGDVLDIDRLAEDFRCMSFVGVRGYGIEKGLEAAVAAVDPDLAGPGGANEGFLRPDARFGLLFVTDENDCSHDGSLDEATPCGGDVCAFANAVDAHDSPLVAPTDLQAELIQNLRDSKQRPDFGAADVFAASIHGISSRFDGEIPTETECSGAEYDGVGPSCTTALGTAFSGDRYERFLRSFPDGNYFPASTGPDTSLTGWVCTGDFRPALEAIGQAIGEL